MYAFEERLLGLCKKYRASPERGDVMGYLEPQSYGNHLLSRGPFQYHNQPD